MDLPTYIDQIGDEQAGKLFGVSKRTAQSWRLRERMPRPKQARVIVERTHGRVGYSDIYNSNEVAA